MEEATGEGGTRWGKEPRWGRFSSLKSRKKGALGDRVRGLPQDKLPLPIAPWLEDLWGPSEFRRCMTVREEEEGGKEEEGG